MVNKENMLKWVEALESGDYEQGRRYLERYNTFCRLGVVCRVALANGVNLLVDISPVSEAASFDAATGALPDLVQYWLGIDQSDPAIGMYNGEYISAVKANDDLKFNFVQIAILLRQHYQLS